MAIPIDAARLNMEPHPLTPALSQGERVRNGHDEIETSSCRINIIELQDICMRFERNVVHQNLNLTVLQGEIVSLVGGSGSGKTTVLRQILGLQRPTSGSVRVFGADIARASAQQMQALRQRWGMLFQQGALFSSLTAFENVAQPLRELRTLPEDLIRDTVLLKLGMVDLSPADALKMPANLSGGMIKRVALARALALEPELLFLDEPTAGLDPDMSETFVRLLRSLHRELKLTVVMVTHDLDTLLALSSKIAVLADQRVIINAAPAEVIAFEHPFIKEFFLGERGRRALEALTTESPPLQGASALASADRFAGGQQADQIPCSTPGPLPEGEGEGVSKNSNPKINPVSG
ncbi:MAG: ATP-binding cassette domain-containing protein [Burkholderiaceae bacterium]